MGELALQTLVVLFGGGEPHSVVFLLFRFFAQHQDNLVSNVNGETAEHGAGFDRERGKCFEHKLVGNRLTKFDRKFFSFAGFRIAPMIVHALSVPGVHS